MALFLHLQQDSTALVQFTALPTSFLCPLLFLLLPYFLSCKAVYLGAGLGRIKCQEGPDPSLVLRKEIAKCSSVMPHFRGCFAAACSSVNSAEQASCRAFTVSHMEDQSHHQVGGCVEGTGLPLEDCVLRCAEGKRTLTEVVPLGKTCSLAGEMC